MLLCGADTWTLQYRKQVRKLLVLQMRYLRMLRSVIAMTWRDRVDNAEVPKREHTGRLKKAAKMKKEG